MDNMPPTTSDSSISNISGSPGDERTGGLSPTSEDNVKLNRDNSEVDNSNAGKDLGFSEDDTLPNSESNSADKILKPPAKRTVDDTQSPKKRKRNRKHSECGNGGSGNSSGSGNVGISTAAGDGIGIGVDASIGVGINFDVGIGINNSSSDSNNNNSSGGNGGGGNNSGSADGGGDGSGSGDGNDNGNVSGCTSNSGSGSDTVPKKLDRQNNRHGRYGAGSDSDDTSEGSNLCGMNNMSTNHTSTITNVPHLSTYSLGPPIPTKYNFYVELDPELDGSQRIAVLEQKLTELRKTYNAVKVELAAIERRRKKLKRRERESDYNLMRYFILSITDSFI